MDPLQWMGAVRIRVQTADKSITMIPKYSTPLQYIDLMSCEAKSCMFVINQLIRCFHFKSQFKAKLWVRNPPVSPQFLSVKKPFSCCLLTLKFRHAYLNCYILNGLRINFHFQVNFSFSKCSSCSSFGVCCRFQQVAEAGRPGCSGACELSAGAGGHSRSHVPRPHPFSMDTRRHTTFKNI